MACAYFFEYFESGLKAGREVQQIIRESVLSTQSSMLGEESECSGMAATFSLVVWCYESEEMYFCNIGDSRIYAILNDQMICITKDDSITSPGGYASLTQCLGKEGLKFDVQQTEMKTGQMMVLCSDGFYNSRKASLNNKLIAFAKAEHFEEAFIQLTKDFSLLRGDDLTVIAIKNG